MLLEYYNHLRSEDPEERSQAAVGLIKDLMERDSEEDWDYAFNRLLKGLASSNKASRLGFGMTLSELLRIRHEKIKLSDYLDLCDEYFKVGKGANGHEERGCWFGRLFAMQNLLNAPSILVESCNLHDFKRFLDMVVMLASQKAWLRKGSVAILCQLFNSDARNSIFKKVSFDLDVATQYLLEQLNESKLTFTSDGCALYLCIGRERCREFFDNTHKGWKDGDPLSKKNSQSLIKVLKEVPVDEEHKAQKEALWMPHYVWNYILEELLATPQEEEADETDRGKKHKNKKRKKSKNSDKESLPHDSSRCNLSEFWKVVVDEGMFSQSASSESKFSGFGILKVFLENLNKREQVEVLFSPNLLRCLINQLSGEDRHLNKAAKRIVNIIKQTSAEKSFVTIPVIKAFLTGKNGSPNFDKLTNTKTVEELVSLVPKSQLKELSDMFCGIFVSPGVDKNEKPKAIDGRRQWALDYLLKIVRSRTREKKEVNGKSTWAWIDTIDWIEVPIDLLIKCGYFKNAQKCGPELSERGVETSRDRLDSIMKAIVGMPRPNDGGSWAYYVIDRITTLEEKEELINPFQDELLTARDKALKTVKKIHKKRKTPHIDGSELKAFELLFSLVLLRVYSSDTDAASVLDEIQMCYNNIIGQRNIEEIDVDEEIDTSQVLTEILLTFLSKKSALLRKLSETVWETFSSEVSAESLGLLYDVLQTKESKEGQDEMFEGEDDEGEEEEDDDDEEKEKEDSDNEANDESGDEEEEEESDDESDTSEDMDEEMKEADREYNKQLADALRVNEEAAEEKSSGSESDDDESMDDEQMLALDGHLVNVLRQRQALMDEHKKKKKTEERDAKQNVVEMKSRVLDLVDLYVKTQPSNLNILTAIVPLLSLIRTTKERQLGEKAHKILKASLCKVREPPVLQNDDEYTEVLVILDQIHQQARKSTNNAHSLASNQCSIFVSKIIVKYDPSKASEVVSIYAESLTDWVQRKQSKINPGMFNDFVNWVTSTKKK